MKIGDTIIHEGVEAVFAEKINYPCNGCCFINNDCVWEQLITKCKVEGIFVKVSESESNKVKQ